METLISFIAEPAFDIQLDTHLEAGDVIHSPGPDRAYLYLPYSLPGVAGRPDRREGAELLAVWVLDSPTAGELLATGLGAPQPQCAQVRPFEVSWIRGGVLAVKRQRIGADAAMWLLTTLAAENQLDYAAELFGGHSVDEG